MMRERTGNLMRCEGLERARGDRTFEIRYLGELLAACAKEDDIRPEMRWECYSRVAATSPPALRGCQRPIKHAPPGAYGFF